MKPSRLKSDNLLRSAIHSPKSPRQKAAGTFASSLRTQPDFVTSQKRGARANGTKISHQDRIFKRINLDELGFEVIRKVKIWLNLVAFARAPSF